MRKLLIMLLSAVFLVSGGVLISRSIQYRESEASYAQAARLAGLTQAPGIQTLKTELQPQTTEEPVITVDTEALQAVNGDVIGWIHIPGTAVSYPLMQHDNNGHYLNHSWEDEPNSSGAIFLDYRADLSSFHSLIYGHNMQDGSMFASLKSYVEPEFRQEHPDVYIIDGELLHRYEVFAAYEASVYGHVYGEIEDPQDFIDKCIESSVIDCGIAPEEGDNIITLSTCTGYSASTRWVVQAVLRS